MKYQFLILCILFTVSCNKVKEEDFIEEDYESLFPDKGIEKPETERGDITIHLGNPEMTQDNYIYPGVEFPYEAEKYNVTLTCRFLEKNQDNSLVNNENISSRYEIRYINEKKELITITTRKSEETENSQIMKNGEELTIQFTAYSGYPLYLCVTGLGPRESSVKAKIEAVSADNLITLPELQIELFQNNEGIDKLETPYCEYFILP